MQTSDNISAQSAPPKVPAKSSYDKFGKGTQMGHFLRFCKGGTKGKSAKKWANFGAEKKQFAQIAWSSN